MATDNNTLYTIVKARFKAIDTNTFGLLLVFLNNNLKVVENLSVIASHFSSLYETDPQGSWADMEDRIFSMKWRGEYATSITRDIQIFLESALKGDRSDELYSLTRQNASSKVENMIFTLLMKPLGEKNIHIELGWENVSAEEIQMAKEARESRDDEGPKEPSAPETSPEASEFNLEEGSVLLDVDLILAPVSGIPIFELQRGEKIMVKISPATNRGRYFIDLLNAMHDNEVIPVPAPVSEVKINRFNEYVILVKIGEGIYGKATETEQVKLKRFDPNSDKRTVQPAMKNLAAAGFGNPVGGTPPSSEDKAIANLHWLMYLGGFIILVMILVIIIFLI